ncbi:hypothetical protein ACQW02_09150 [Humitalea sp. 24SJ18S-53]|uniref:hypothetical protein n=1 Tax=Humitalea sp. 24SJ18S-53 TaxID=3422307 RepID=UPI003D6730EC
MRNHLNSILAAALLVPAFSLGAIAADGVTYPRVVGSGENIEVEYGPAERENIVGGGQMGPSATGYSGEASYLEAGRAQLPPFGAVPTTRDNNENMEIVWVPNSAGETMLASRGFGAARN